MYASEDMSSNNCLAWKPSYYTAQDMATDLLYSRRENGNFHLSYHAWQLLDIELWLEL